MIFTAIMLTVIAVLLTFQKNQRETCEGILKQHSSPEEESEKRLMRSATTKISSSTSPVFEKKCIFCKSATKKYQGEKQRLIRCEVLCSEKEDDLSYSLFQRNVIKYADILKDNEMLSHMKCIDVIAKEVHYHNICRTRYQTKAETLTKTGDGRKNTMAWS